MFGTKGHHMKTVQRMAGPKRAAGTCKMGIHKNAYALYSGPGRKPRNGKVTVTVDKVAVANAFGTSRDTNAARTASLVTARPDQAFRPAPAYLEPQQYGPVILPSSHSITR